MSASIVQKKAAFAQITGAGSVSATLDNPITPGSRIFVAMALVQSDGSSAFQVASMHNDVGDNYSPVSVSTGQGPFANTFYNIIETPGVGARTYTFSYTTNASPNYLAGICVYELSGSDYIINGSGSQGLSGLHKIADLSASVSGLNGGTYGNFIVNIGALLFTSLTDANAAAAGSGWTLDGRDAVQGTNDALVILFESQLVGPSSNPAGTFSGTATSDEIDGTLGIVAVLLTSAIAGGGGGGTYDPTKVFLGSVTVVDSDTDDNGVFLGTVSVVSEAQSGVPNPYLGKVRVVSAPAGRSNPTLGQVVVVESAPSNDSNPFLGQVATS